MATDPNKKTLRHFQCRDYLWETFEQLSGELECSVDYLINEAMRQYARSRQQGGRVSTPPAPRESAPPMPPVGRPPMIAAPPVRGGAMPVMPPMSGAGGPRIPALPGGPRPPMGTPAAPPSRPGMPAIPPMRGATGAAPPLPRASAQIPAMRPPTNPPPAMRPQPPAMSVPPRMPTAPPQQQTPPSAPGVPPGPTLYAIYEGQSYPVTKDEFIIGRGQKTSDLCIRDSNVSRRHAVIVIHNNQFWMVDQKSTNGVEFAGAKIDRKRIEDGDLFKICDYEVQFVYR
ncbi:MAG: FHA domain-containing protein [Deltaproteobacteria bacterium]|nr:FHA domain-containing protein [Deltaproteobacteria bacterium]